MASLQINMAESMEMQIIQAIDNFVNAHASFIFVYNGAQSGHQFGFNMIDYSYPSLLMIYCGYVVFDVTHRAMEMQFWRRAIRLDQSNAIIVKNTLLRDDHEILNNIMFMGVAHTFIMLNMWIIFMCGDGHGQLKEVYVPACVAYAICWGAGVIYGYIIKYLTFGTLNVPKKMRNEENGEQGDQPQANIQENNQNEQNNQENLEFIDEQSEEVEESDEFEYSTETYSEYTIQSSNSYSQEASSSTPDNNDRAENNSTVTQPLFTDESIQRLQTYYSESQE